jgi:hypothetical protein
MDFLVFRLSLFIARTVIDFFILSDKLVYIASALVSSVSISFSLQSS